MKKVAIVGAGPVGCCLGKFLAKRKNIALTYLEKRPDPRLGKIETGRSVNVTMSF
jgi:kynurenine 3-monooxygenase